MITKCIHEIFVCMYTHIVVACNHKFLFMKFVIWSQFHEINKDFEPQKFGAIQYMYLPLCTCRFGGRHSTASHLEIMELSLTSGVVSTELLSQTTQRRMSMLALTSSTLW